MNTDPEMPQIEQPGLDYGARRARIEELTAVLALQAHDLAALGRIDLVKPMLNLKNTLRTISDAMSRTQLGESDRAIASAVDLIKAADEILRSQYRSMTIH